MKAQTIQIDSTFNSDGEIFPFGPNDTIYGLSISGSVSLLTDTSLVRVILTDNSGNEWMVYEAYPMIVDSLDFDIEEECDETCFLEEFHPHSLSIQIISAEISISELSFSTTRYENLTELQQEAKRTKDLEKVQLMNQYITRKGWEWVAGENELLSQYYLVKAIQFGFDKYNVRGYDYYISGEFKYVTSREFIKNSGTLRADFDWRSKHDANIEETPYYSAEGWLTGLRRQYGCGACWVFSSVASVEAVANLYFNQHCDYDLSEHDVLCCSTGGGNCSGGYTYNSLNYLKNNGTFNEENFPYDEDGPWYYHSCCDDNHGSPKYNLKCSEKSEVPLSIMSLDTLKTRLINTGPIVTWILNESLRLNHAVSLIGYYTDRNNDIQFVFKDSDQARYWTTRLAWTDIEDMYSVGIPITVTVTDGQTPERIKWDKDKDGYYNWGIGGIPEGWEPPCGQQLPDWNDHQSRIGFCDANFIGQSVMPEMKVEIFKMIQSGNQFIPIEQEEIVGFDQADLNMNNQLVFKIENPGTALLNLIPHSASDYGMVTIEYQHPSEIYSINLNDLPLNKICMDDGESVFFINLNTAAENGALAKVRIWVNEPEIDDFEFTLIYNGCETEPGSYPIETPVIWNEQYRTQLQDVDIKNNGELIVTGTVLMSSEVDIVVERGGKLTLDGGTLTSSCGDLWNGVDIWGNASMPQEPYYQGIVELLNGGTIEFADTAISTYRTSGSSLIYSGGLIHSTDAFFKENYIGICLAPYTNPNGGGNRSTFKRTQFSTSDNYYEPNNVVRSAPKCGIQMSWVNGLNFEGCTFINDSKAEKRKRGCGILNMDADFHVKNACVDDNQIGCEPTIASHFEGLDYGIRSLNVWSFRKICVESADFIDNFRGIYLSLNFDASLLKNHFELTADNEYFDNGDTLVGIYTDACSRYQIEKNNFIGDDPDHFDLVGMHILNSGEDNNEVYNNYFENLDYGIIAAGINKNKDGSSGLCIKCNDFTKCQTDILVTPAGYDPGVSGIANPQGVKNKPPATESDLAAGNTFSDFIDDENNYWNDNSLTTLQYVHHNHLSTPDKVVPDPYTNIILEEDEYAAYSKESSCPSRLQRGGLILSEEQSKFNLENSTVSSIEDSLNLIIDEGDTPGLNFQIITSNPDEALQLHQELMDISPYLSDTVIKSAIEKENVLLNAMIRDVLVSNPQAAKEPDIMEKLDDRLDPLPDYMMDEIIAGQQYYGAKELALQDLAAHKERMAESLSNCVWIIKQDTIASQVCDGLIVLLESIENIKDKYEMAFIHMSTKDTVSAISTLNDIPQEFSLNPQLQNEHESYLELFEILPVLLADSCIIDSSLFQRIFDIADVDNSLPGIYSRNLLETKSFLTYEEPVYLGNAQLKSNSIATSNNNYKDVNSPYLEIFPNPSNTFFIIKYDLKGYNSTGTLLISDQTGKILKNFSLNDPQNQKIIETNSFSSGIYHISLYVNKQLKAQAKLIIQ